MLPQKKRPSPNPGFEDPAAQAKKMHAYNSRVNATVHTRPVSAPRHRPLLRPVGTPVAARLVRSSSRGGPTSLARRRFVFIVQLVQIVVQTL